MLPRKTNARVLLLAALLAATATDSIFDEARKFVPNEGLEEVGRAGVADAAVDPVPTEGLKGAGKRTFWQSVALDMPKGPFKGQKRAPCLHKGEVEISKACWVQVGTSPPCGSDRYEWKSFCYVPVLAPERPNTSDEP
jgi:eukaryotic-like serine/threonine-protein kinase